MITSSSNSDRVSMETEIGRLKKMRAEIITTLGEKFGPTPSWEIAANQTPVISTASCQEENGTEDIPGAETAFLPNWGASGTYPRADWHTAGAVVRAVAKKYGFDQVSTPRDSPGDYLIDLRAPDGARVTFGFASNSALTIASGCYVWEHRPSQQVPEDSIPVAQ